MSRIEDSNLDVICGGGTTNITGTLLSAVSDVIKVIFEAGHAVGSSIRRMTDKKLCPLK